jgi:hypothetical protein
MFKKKTVFVIGAGASAEFGMPIGVQLRNRIAPYFNFSEDSASARLHQMLVPQFGANAPIYTQAELSVSKVVAEFPSIDEILHYFSTEPEIVMLGKAAIVREILAAERKSTLFDMNGSGLKTSTERDENWLQHFFSMAISSTLYRHIRHAFKMLTIINFNYDRIIEHYLYNALQNQALIHSVAAKEAVSSLEILRPYGKVGPLDWQSDVGVVFGSEINHDDDSLFSTASSIRIYTESLPRLVHIDRYAPYEIQYPTIRSKITSALREADVVVFLGFGFHEQNMDLLRGAEIGKGTLIFATAYGIHEENFPYLKQRILDMFNNPSEIPFIVPWKASEMLSRMRSSIM